MSSLESPGELVSDHGSQVSTASSLDFPRTSAPRELDLLLYYVANRDDFEAFLVNGHSPGISSEESSISRMRNCWFKFELWFHGLLSGASITALQDRVDIFPKGWTKTNEDKQINEFISTFKRDRAIVVCPARKQLPAGENVPWDIRNGEERTQPRRRPWTRASHNQAPASLFSESLNGIQIQRESQNSMPTTSSQYQLQVTEPTDSNLNLRQNREHSSLSSDESVTVTPTIILGGSPACIPHRSSQSFDPLLDGTVPFLDSSLMPVYDMFTSAPVTNEAPRALMELPSQQLSTGQPDVISNEVTSEFANQFTPKTSNNSSSHSTDTMTTSGESIESPFRDPLTPPISLQSNGEPIASREPIISYKPVDPEGRVDSGSIVNCSNHDYWSAQVGKEIPKKDPDPDWLRDYIHQHMIMDPADE